MRSGNRNLTFWLLCAATAIAVPCATANAQNVQKPAAADPAKKDPNVALKALDAGTKSYSAGKFDPAVQSLTAALANGGLPPQKMAQAYYYRGMAYKKQKKPAQALSDLTVAVWVNGGLSEADRAAAMNARNEVYREAGLGDQAPPIANAVGTPSPSTAAAAPAPAPQSAPAPQAPAPVAKAPSPPAADSFATAVAPAPQAQPKVAAAPPPPPAAAPTERPVWQADPNSSPPPPMPLPADTAAQAPPAPSPATSGQVATLSPLPGSSGSSGSTPPSTGLAPTGDEATAQPSSSSPDIMAPLASAGSSISGFFSNMFGQGGQQKEAAAPPPPAQTTGSTGASEGFGWAQNASTSPQGPSVQVSASEPQRAPGYEAPTPPPSAAATARSVVTSANGKYRLQLASVRSREEADRLAQTVMTNHGSELGGAAAEVDETVIGNMGTFYRVRLGPYANAAEPRKLCTSLKPQGYDCQVVTQ